MAQDALTCAEVSTIDPACLSLCLDVQKQVKVHTYLYELHREVQPLHADDEALTFRLIEAGELDRTIGFQVMPEAPTSPVIVETDCSFLSECHRRFYQRGPPGRDIGRRERR